RTALNALDFVPHEGGVTLDEHADRIVTYFLSAKSGELASLKRGTDVNLGALHDINRLICKLAERIGYLQRQCPEAVMALRAPGCLRQRTKGLPIVEAPLTDLARYNANIVAAYRALAAGPKTRTRKGQLPSMAAVDLATYLVWFLEEIAGIKVRRNVDRG